MGTETLTSYTHPAGKLKKITASASPQDPRPRALYIDTAGTMDIENEDATTEAGINLVAGTVVPFQAYKITAISGAIIMGLYE